MDTFDAINQRRSLKAFDPGHRLSASEETNLLEAAVDQAQVTDASLLIKLTADLKAWRKSPERYWRNASPEIRKLAVGWIVPFDAGKDRLQRDEAIRSCGSAGQTIMLAVGQAVKPAWPKGAQLDLADVTVHDHFA